MSDELIVKKAAYMIVILFIFYVSSIHLHHKFHVHKLH